jgi:hypothetical protein
VTSAMSKAPPSYQPTPPPDLGLFAEDAVNITSMPTDDEARSIGDLARELLFVEGEFSRTEAHLDAIRDRRKVLRHIALPDAFDRVGTDRLGVPDSDPPLDIVVVPYYHASIPTDEESPNPEPAFDHLEELGAGDLLRTTVAVSFGRGGVEAARDLLDYISRWNSPEQYTTSLRRGVPWNSLTKWLREYMEDIANPSEGDKALPSPDLALLNATVGRVAKIQKRKTTATARRRK